MLYSGAAPRILSASPPMLPSPIPPLRTPLLSTLIGARAAVAATAVMAACMFLSLAGCAGMTERDRDTVIGAGVGAAAGAALTHGDALGTVGGAAVGGVIGNQVGKP